MNANEVGQDVGVITGILLLDSVPVVVLFDFISIHTFIGQTFVRKIGVGLEHLGYDFVVTTLVGVVLTTGESVRGVVVAI